MIHYLAYIPSPTISYLNIFNLFKIHYYAICILIGLWLGTLFFLKRIFKAYPDINLGLVHQFIFILAIVSILFARLYHVITDYELYFGAHQDWTNIFRIYKGGLGIYGAIIGGMCIVFYYSKRFSIPFLRLLDILTPSLAIGQAFGRWGNWFNNELYGKKTSLPWGLQIHSMDNGTAIKGLDLPGYYHPVFLYESLLCIFGFLMIIHIERNIYLFNGNIFMIYCIYYASLRGFIIEPLRDDYAHHLFGLRINVIISMIIICICIFNIMYIYISNKREIKNDCC